MNAHERRRRLAPIVWTFAVLMALPPGLFTERAHATAYWYNEVTRDSLMESFRNPAISSGQYNRFLMTQNPWELLGGGGEDLMDPDERGNQWFAEPNASWLPKDGRVEWTEQDIFLPGLSFDLQFSRVYRGSVASYDGPLGKRWDFNWNKRIKKLTPGSYGNVVLYDMGRIETYVYNSGSGSWTSPAGRYDTLVDTGGPIERTDRFGIKETYTLQQFLTEGAWYYLEIMDDLHYPYNHMDFDHDAGSGGDGHLTSITNDAGFLVDLDYDSSGRITSVDDFSGREWIYAYDSSGNLTSVRTPTFNDADDGHDFTGGRTTVYKYDGDGRLTAILQPKDSAGDQVESWKWEYDAAGQSGKVTKQYINGNPIALAYDTTNQKVTVVDREVNGTIWEYDSSSRVTKRKTYYTVSNSWDTTWAYNSDGEVTEVVFPKGNRISYTYDSLGNIVTVLFKKDGSDTTPIQWTYTYATHSRLSTLTDPNGRTWDYDYDSYGDLTQKTAPAVTLPSGIATTNKNSQLNSTNDGTIVEKWEYDEYGNITESTDAMGTVYNSSYIALDPDGGKIALTKLIADPGAGKINITYQWVYDEFGHAVTYVDPTGIGISCDFNTIDEVIRVVEPLGVVYNYYHDLNGNIMTTTQTDDNVQGYGDFVSNLDFDRLNNLTRLIIDQDASTRLTTSYEYDKNDRLTMLTKPGGRVTQWAYDVRDLPSAITRKAATSYEDSIITITYDSNENRTTITDPRSTSYSTILAYDGYDRVTRLTRPEGNYQAVAYDTAGNTTDVSWHNSGATKLAEAKYSYDQANRLYLMETLAKKADLSTNIDTAGGSDEWQTRTLWRDEKGNVLEVTGEGCGCSLNTYVYDALERLSLVKDAMPTSPNHQNIVDRDYDLRGDVTRVTRKDKSQDTGIEGDKDIVVEYQYDQRQRMTKQRDYIGSASYADTIIDYGKRDQVTKITDGASRATLYEYNERLWPTKEWVDFTGGTSSDAITEHLYDIAARKITYKATNGGTGDQSTVYEYDPLWRLAATTWPDAEISAYTWDKASNRVSYTDPNGTVRVAQYDKNNRLTLQDHTLAMNVVGATQLIFDYDGLDRLTGAEAYETSPAFESQVFWTYNTFSKIETEKQVINGWNSGNGRTFSHAWNIDGQRASVTYPTSGEVISFERDAVDRVDKISMGSNELVDYIYSGDRVIGKDYAESRATFTYDYFGRLTYIKHEDTNGGSAQQLAGFGYGYDAGHQAIWLKKLYYDNSGVTITADRSDKGEQYAYDAAGRLVSCLRGVADPSSGTIGDNYISGTELAVYVYDQTGNRTTRTVTPHGGSPTTTAYAYNAVNEMTTEAGASQNYTDNGSFSGASNTYKYEHADRLARASSGGWTYKYHYDALGRVIQRDHATTNIRFYYDGLHIAEQNAKGQTEEARKLFVFGPQIDELLLYVDIAANPDEYHYAHTDRLGSIQVFADEAGDIEESYRYKEFGETTIVNSSFAKLTTTVTSPIGNPHRYTGRRQDIQVGSYGDDWYDYRARVYRPAVGRFLSRDPVGYIGSSLYLYVHDDPINYYDPFGLIDNVKVEGNNVTIELPVSFAIDGSEDGRKFPSITEEEFEAAKEKFIQRVQSRWSGPFGRWNVVCLVRISPYGTKQVNKIVFRKGSIRGAGGITAQPGDDMAWIDITQGFEPHEAGHLMHLDEGYGKVIGEDRLTNKPGYDGNIMGLGSEGTVAEFNIDDVIKNADPPPKAPAGSGK